MKTNDFNNSVLSFKKKLNKIYNTKRQWATREGITSYRLFAGFVAHLSLVIDIYNKSLHVVVRETKNPVLKEELDYLAKQLSGGLYIQSDRVFIKYRKELTEHEQYTQIGQSRITDIVEEGGLDFKVNLSDYNDTGLFLDHRITRDIVREMAGNARVLNLFCYTGSFSVYAAEGGARQVDSVDLSATYLKWAEDNFRLNNIPLSEDFRFIRDDVLGFLDRQIENQARYNLIILDPPTFSNSRKMDSSFNVQKNHPEIINKCLSLLSKKGTLIFSTNYSAFVLKRKEINAGAISEITAQTIPEDFKGEKPHLCWLIK